ncbi:MAG TPA: alginate export family protein [Steroidobacteraceae bacterium]|nr:alginate export family protein [Steroidobacteraceae bacterium]
MPLHSSAARSARLSALAAGSLLVFFASLAVAEEEAAPSPPPPPGLPAGIDWKFDFSAGWGSFGFSNSLYTNPKPDDVSGDLSDNWFEGSITAGIGGTYTLGNSSQLYGKVSGVGERTYGSPPSLVGDEHSSYDVEDLYVGWRSGKMLGDLGENALDFTVGRTQYKLGHGMLLWDGSSEGGSRGGYWTNARKAFEFAAIGRFKPGKNTLEAFYLKRDELPESQTDSKLWGVNYEYAFNESNTVGATYMKWSANENAPQRDGLDVYDVRAFVAPIPSLQALSFEFEYAKEDNGDALDSEAYNALVAYQFDTVMWKPKVSYRYAYFQGDNPGTVKNEAFDGLFTGFYDWGTWWQGEIAGEYFVSNSNLISHQVRVHTKPTDSIGTGLIFYDFLLDRPVAPVTSDKVAWEVDWYMDWSLNDHFLVSFVAAYADPGQAVEQSSGRTDNFTYGMIFVAYTF